MIRKRQLMNFIDAVEKKAVGSVEKRYQKLIDKEQEKVLATGGYISRLNNVQRRINDLLATNRQLEIDMKDDKSIDYQGEGHYGTLSRELRDFEGKGYLNKILSRCEFDGGSVEKILHERDTEIKAVKDNYNKVRIVCERKPNGAQIAEYLKGLGFDISSLEKNESKALAVEIDKSKLFVCGENK